MLVVDGHGVPLGFHLAGAEQAEVRLAEQRPAKLVAGRGYDSAGFRVALRRREMAMYIPPKRRPVDWRAKRGRPVVARKDDYRRRYSVERSFAWLGNCRRLLIRWERLFRVYASWFTVAVLRLCLRRLV